MTEPTDAPKLPEFRDSDQVWYDALSGAPVADPEAPAAREGQALRAALEQRHRELEAQPGSDDDAVRLQAQLSRLQDRVKAEGIFETLPAEPAPPVSARVVPFPWWQRPSRLLALAASIALAAIGVTQLMSQTDYPEPPAILGSGVEQTVSVANPKAAAEGLVDSLRKVGLRPGLYQQGRTYVVDLQLLPSELPAAAAAYSRLGIEAKPGFNRTLLQGR